MAVIVADDGDGIPWAEGGYGTYIGQKEDGSASEWVLLHPVCFSVLFDEMCRQGIQASLIFMLGHVGEIRQALSM
jgi:hypothetical protein